MDTSTIVLAGVAVVMGVVWMVRRRARLRDSFDNPTSIRFRG